MNAVEKVAVAYDADFYEWLRHQTHLLKERRLAELDLEHLTEEIEDLGNELLASVQSWAAQILAHLVCLKLSPASDPKAHWEDEVATFRLSLTGRLENSPSLERKLSGSYDKMWLKARRLAQVKLRRDGVTQLPAECPFTLAQVLDPDFFPEPDR